MARPLEDSVSDAIIRLGAMAEMRPQLAAGDLACRDGARSLPAQTVGVTPRLFSVADAAAYLGVSAQTVYLWVERKQIPHLRVMGRNIRFLKSDLEPFRATFKQDVGIGKTE